MNNNKLIKTARFNTELNKIIGTNFNSFTIYRSNGLYTHLQKRKHYYIATMFDIKRSKIDSYLKSGRLKKVNL